MQRDVEEADVDIAPLARSLAPRTSPASSAIAAVVPVIRSMIDKPKRAGGLSGSPVTDRYPASACIR